MADTHRVLELRPVPEGQDSWSAEALRECIHPATLPTGEKDEEEKVYLRSVRGWKDPQGLEAYSKDGDYYDLYVYFDAADKASPVNVAATKAFNAYTDVVVRGPCVVVRAAPPTYKLSSHASEGPSGSHQCDFKPLISVTELVDTLLFYKTRDPKKVAHTRDMARTRAQYKLHGLPFDEEVRPGERSINVSWNGSMEGMKLSMTPRKGCATCNKREDGSPGGVNLLKCARCEMAYYCSRECQKADWPKHKQACKAAAAASEAARAFCRGPKFLAKPLGL